MWNSTEDYRTNVYVFISYEKCKNNFRDISFRRGVVRFWDDVA